MSAAEAPLPGPSPRQPRRARLLPWPLVQAVIYHPTIQWAMANLGVRRWLAIRRWPALVLAASGLGMVTDDMHVARWEHDLVGSVLYLALVVTALSTDAYLARRARRLAGLRSRATYLAMGAGLLPPAVGCIAVASGLGARNAPLADVAGSAGLLISWIALLALGRALTWGRLRRLCWVYPPGGRRP